MMYVVIKANSFLVNRLDTVDWPHLWARNTSASSNASKRGVNNGRRDFVCKIIMLS